MTSALEPVKVLCVAGAPRSGTTIVSRLISQSAGYAFTGESTALWEGNGTLGSSIVCGCGTTLSECDFWQHVLQLVPELRDQSVTRIAESFQRRRLKPRSLPRVLLPHWENALQEAAPCDYVLLLQKVFTAVRAVADAAVVVDSSKYPLYLALLSSMPGLDVRILHIVRDPRGVAFSWRQEKSYLPRKFPESQMARWGPLKSAALWNSVNLFLSFGPLAESQSYQMVRYEDVARHPALLSNALNDLGLPPFIEPTGGTAPLVTQHTLGGNPSRFLTGDVPISVDTRWTTSMSTLDRSVMTVLCLPLLHRYRYPMGRRVWSRRFSD